MIAGKKAVFGFLLTCGIVSIGYGEGARDGAMQSERLEDRPAVSPPKEKGSIDAQTLDYFYNRTATDGSAAGTVGDEYRRNRSEISVKQAALESLIAADKDLPPVFLDYLSQEGFSKGELEEYSRRINHILALLRDRKVIQAWESLLGLSEFSWDARISDQIAARVRVVWDTDSSMSSILNENKKLKENIKNANWNADTYANSLQREKEEKAAKGGKSADVQSSIEGMTKGLPGSLKVTEEYFRSLDAKAKIKLNEIKLDSISATARTDLAEYISTLYKNKKYTHVIVAGGFYQALFTDGKVPAEISNQITAASQFIGDSARSVASVRYNIDQKNLSAALSILRDAWSACDCSTDILGLKREQKLKLIEYANSIQRLKNLIEARDFDGLEKHLEYLEKLCIDFDTVKPRAIINSIKLDSSIKLGKARIYAQQGNTGKALEEFKAAAEVWPGNPDLKSAASEYFATEDIVAKMAVDFDREIKSRNFRGIAERQLEFLQVANTSEKRKEEFKQALEKVRLAEGAIEKGKALGTSGDWCGAWEAVEVAAEAWADDVPLNRSRADFSAKAVEFVSLIKKAQAAEESGAHGAGASLYASARSRYPYSKLAQEGILRTSDKILSKSEGKGEKGEGVTELR